MGMPKQENYAASKGAIISLMRSLAVEFGRFGVTANTLLPGFIETPNFPIIDVAKKRFFPRIPMGRGGKPEDLGAISIYLASDASSYHTGDCFTIDGGFSLSF